MTRARGVRQVATRPDRLAPAVVDELWAFMSRFSERSRDAFDQALFSQDRVVMLRDRADDRLVGLLTCRWLRPTIDGKPHTLLYGHWGMMDPDWRGSNVLPQAYLGLLLRTWVRHPWKGFHILMGTTTGKSYAHVARNAGTFWPRHDTPWTPEAWALLCAGMEALGEPGWNPETGVVQRNGEIRFFDSGLDNPDDPDLAFYAEANPHHARGDMLMTLTPFDLKNATLLVLKMVQRAGRRRRRAGAARRGAAG